MTSTKIQLYCPSNRTTVDDFVIAPYATNEQVLQGVRLAVGIKYAALYNTDAKAITDVHSLQENNRVLVAASPEEQMLPDAPLGFVLYSGEEGDDVDLDVEGAGQPWEELTDREKCDHISSLSTMKPSSRNTLRITLSWHLIQADLVALEAVQPEAIDTAAAETRIEQCWRLTWDQFLPNSMMPSKFKFTSNVWDQQVLATLSILSSFTHGQASLAHEFLKEAIKMRVEEGKDVSPVVQAHDVKNTITIIYERAGVIPAKLTKMKQGKIGGRERRKALKERKKKDKSLGSGST